MVVNSINYLNLDTLYDIALDKRNGDKYKVFKFSRNFSELLNHVVITLQLSDVTMYEYIFLKTFLLIMYFITIVLQFLEIFDIIFVSLLERSR